MEEPIKSWKKCIAVRTLTDYTIDPPKVREWTSSISTYDEIEDVMIVKEFNEDGQIIEECIYYDNEFQIIDYDESGNKTSDELVKLNENEHGGSVQVTSDLEGNVNEERPEYDINGRCIKKIFIENGKEDSWLEFDYDTKDRVIMTRNFVDRKLESFDEDIYVSDSETLTYRYNSIGQLISKTEHKRLIDSNTSVNYYFDDYGNLTKRVEEDRDNEDEVIEQRIYDNNGNIIYQMIFGENNEFGFRSELKEFKFSGDVLIEKAITRYEYQYI